MTKVTLFIPGLFGPNYDFVADYIPELPALCRLLSKASVAASSRQSNYRLLYELMGFAADPDHDIPVAAVTRRLDLDEGSKEIWMRADPVHLHADREGVVMLDASTFQLNRHDALAMAGDLKESFELMGWELEVPVSDRWYLRLPEQTDMQTVEPDRVTGNDVFHHLPKGKQAKDWHRLINEIQMLLHNSEVNQLREQKGEMSVNSLWLWGSGCEPDAIQASWDVIYSSDLFVEGLANLSNTPCHNTPDSIDNIELNEFPQANVLIYLDNIQSKVQYQDLQGWHDMLLNYEENWFLPILEYLQQKHLTEVVIHSGSRVFSLSKMRLMFFWKKTRPFVYFVNLSDT